MTFIRDTDKPFIREKLRAMRSEVALRYFTQDMECDFCRETRGLLEELSALDGRIKLQVFDFKNDPSEVGKYGIDKIPATVIAGGIDYGIRFYGIPAGYEFSSLLESILMVSQGESNLSQESKKIVKGVQVPVHLQVFVTPT